MPRIAPVADSPPPAILVMRRGSWGLSRASILASSASPQGWLDAELAAAGRPDPVDDGLVTRFPVLASTTSDFIARSKAANRAGNGDQMQALNRLCVARAIWSPRQLLERMVDFWSNHLNVTCPSDRVWASRADYDATVVRANALSSFRELLRAALHHPAMLMYLNNDVSSKTQPNENLGRELLELHTVGVEAGYTETDVLNSARILTGMSRDWTTSAYLYRPSWHWTGPVQVLDFSDPNRSSDGQAVVTAYLDHLARHPATARRLATKLCQYFVADTPPSTLVERMAAVYLRNDTAIVPVLREMFLSSEFAASADQKVRRPAEQLYAAVRALGIQLPPTGTEGIETLHWAVQDMAEEPNAWPTPDGYPTSADEWRSAGAMLARTNAVTTLAHGWWKGLVYPPITDLLPRPLSKTHGGLISALYQRLHFRKMPSADLSAVCGYLGVRWSDPVTAKSAVRNPAWDLPQLVGVLLNAPALAIY
ncbi:MAG TPA: DUF1800 domain-containing protein [Kineosporiaceae bacterium]